MTITLLTLAGAVFLLAGFGVLAIEIAKSGSQHFLFPQGDPDAERGRGVFCRFIALAGGLLLFDRILLRRTSGFDVPMPVIVFASSVILGIPLVVFARYRRLYVGTWWFFGVDMTKMAKIRRIFSTYLDIDDPCPGGQVDHETDNLPRIAAETLGTLRVLLESDPDWRIRFGAAHALYLYPVRVADAYQALALLVQGLRDDHPKVQVQCVTSITHVCNRLSQTGIPWDGIAHRLDRDLEVFLREAGQAHPVYTKVLTIHRDLDTALRKYGSCRQ